MDKKITGIASGFGLVLIISFTWFWASQPAPDVQSVQEVAKTSAAQPKGKRKPRTGPRKPPVTFRNKQPQQSPSKNTVPPEQDSSQLDRLEANRQAYYEHLDALDNPNVAELTHLGELAFEANEPDAAYAHYLEVIDEHSDNPLSSFALYKLAWVEFNLGDVEAAIDDMELVLEWIEAGDTNMDESLRSSAVSDLDLFRKNLDSK